MYDQLVYKLFIIKLCGIMHLINETYCSMCSLHQLKHTNVSNYTTKYKEIQSDK